ncbi:unnamed protein product, partial [marine sediment metagenome]
CVMSRVFMCIEEPEGYVWDWDFYVTVLEKADFPPEELEKLRAYLGITSTAPVISNIQISNITPDSVTISWDTDKLAKSKLEYSLNSDLSSSTIVSDYVRGRQPFSITHDYQLANLSQGETYYYKITITDVSHNSSVSSIRPTATPKLGVISLSFPDTCLPAICQNIGKSSRKAT